MVKKENAYCFKCKEKFQKNEVKITRIEKKPFVPPILAKIQKARRGEVVDLKACPCCGSANLSRGNIRLHCNHCNNYFKKEDLNKYG